MKDPCLKYAAFLLVFPLTLISVSCANKQKVADANSTSLGITFEDSMHHFGVIHQESPIDSFDFKFKNTGTDLIVILGARGSCKCTEVKYVPKPVMPGESSYIRVIYDGTGRGSEFFSKSATIYTNASDYPFILKFDGRLE